MRKLLSFVLLLLLTFGMTQLSYAQEKKRIEGVVSDNSGPIPDAYVMVKGKAVETVTDIDGNYAIEADVGDTLVFSFIGLATKEVQVLTTSAIINVVLEEESVIDEVVVTAQGIRKEKKALGYSISQVGGDELENKPEADVARSLQGKVAGVQINAPNGSTGESPEITIRSALSITQNNSPLIVVDNVPFSGQLIDINPNDIKEMSILKGLNASLLYGSEGRNGVILIQTKSGSISSKERISINFSHTSYINQVANLPEYQNRYGQGSDGVFVAGNIGSWGPAFSELDEVPHPYSSLASIFPEYEGVMVPYQAYPDNVKDFFQTGIGQITSLSISTSQEKTAFNLSIGYTDEEGIIGNNDMKRFNLGIGGAAQLTDKWNVKGTMSYTTRKRNSQSGSSLFDLLLYLPRNLDIAHLPYQNPATGENVYYRSDQNPLWLINNTGRNDDVVRLFTTLNTSYRFNDNFTLSYRIGVDSETQDEFDYSNKGGLDDYELGFLELDYDKDVVVDQSVILNSSFKLSNKIGLDTQLGINSRYSTFKSNWTRYEGQIVYGFLRPSNFNTTVSDEDAYNIRATENLAGAFGQFEFNYDDYLYVTLSGRNDWGSTVESENRQLFYPGVSFSFIPTSAFDFNTKMINYLKVRGAYATSSGYPDRYLTRTVLSANSQRFILDDGTNVISNGTPRLLANPNLKPELHREFEVGLEGKFINNRVSLETSAFKRISEDQIVDRGLDGSTGYGYTFTNIGRIDTQGIEVDLGIDIFKGRDFKWNLRNIFTAYETEVVELEEDEIALGGRKFAIPGQPFGILKGSYALRDSEGNFLINPNNGELIISDEIGFEDQIIGNPNPDWTWTMINNFSYRNFSLSTQLEFVKGGEIFSDLAEDLIERGVTRDTENREGSFVLPGVYGDANTGLPYLDANGQTIPNMIQLSSNRTAFSNYYNADDLSTFDASVFRIREIALSYQLGKENLRSIPVENVTFTISGRNIFYYAPGFPKYTNIDPELDTSGGSSGTTVPTTKRYALGISVTF